MVPLPSSVASTASGNGPIGFDTALVYRHPLQARILMGTIGIFFVAVLLTMLYWEPHRAGGPAKTGVLIFLSLIGLVLLGPVVLYVMRWRFEFGRVGLTEHGAFSSSQEIRYADISRVSIVKDIQYGSRGLHVPGYRVKFESRVDPWGTLSLFVNDRYPLDPAIVERLLALPGVSPADVAPLLRPSVR